MAGGCIIPSPKEEELPMSRDALHGWYWAVAAVALVILVILVVWYMEVGR